MREPMSGSKTANARIESTTLGIERGMLTYWLHLDYGGSGQGAGGIRLDGKARDLFSAADYIRVILETVGVENWERLKGAYVRVKYTETGVQFIGNVIRDKWFEICP